MSLYPEEDSYYNATDSSSSLSYGSDEYGYDSGYGGYGAKKEAEEQYYGALSVAVLTLGLVLLVEEVRHRLDHAAVGRPFFMSVLDGIYRELATLGVVELAVHLLQTYTSGLDKNKKAVFADVHFLLFYTAIFNAFQAAILAFASNVVSNKLWVKTEELELDHYVEIREEFDRMHQEMYGVHVPDQRAPVASVQQQHPQNRNQQQTRKKNKTFAKSLKNFSASRRRRNNSQEDGTTSLCSTLKTFFLGVYYTIIFPQKKAKYNQLRVQIRFHEIRVHFLQSYNLPTKMKVCDYLVKSQFHVLEHFVHVSHSTWLLLTAVCNGLYFLMGIIADATGEADNTGYSLSIIFFSVMVVFIIISIVIYYHMESIFKKLMKMNHLWNIWDDGDEDNEENEKKSQELAEQQQGLFAFGDPHLVVHIIQFMQFGYAIALSVVFVYWDDLQKDAAFDASALFYLFAVLLCYTVFLIVMARVLPLYTVCTSLGQLVDKQRLHEVRAAFRLEEAERERREQHYHTGATSTKQSNSSCSTKKSGESSHASEHSFDPTSNKVQSSDEGSIPVPMVVPKLLENSSVSQDSSTRSSTQQSTDKKPADEVRLLADLIKMDTKSLRQMVPPSEKNDSSSSSRRASRSDRRSVSDGIQSMRNLNVSSSSLDTSNSGKEDRKADNSKKVVTFDDSAVQQQKTEDRRLRRERRKTQSAGAAIRAMRDFKETTAPLEINLGDIKEDAPLEDDAKMASDVQAVSPNDEQEATVANPLVANVMDIVPEHESSINELSFTEDDDDDDSMSQLSDVEHNSLKLWEKKRHDDELMYHEPVSYSLKQRLCNYFDGPTYIFVTNIMGTMSCFFLLGMRVEAFLKQQCIIPEDDYSWDLTLDYSFRLLVALLSSFIGVSLVLVLLSPNLKKRKMFFAGVMDIILCTICLVLLLQAESQRCCTDDSVQDESMSMTDEELYGFRMLQDSEACYDVTLECSCADFGHRTSGGLGIMEPFAALIALRIFRFYLAKRLIKTFGSADDHSYEHHSQDHGDGHGHHGHEGEQQGSAVELWQHAIASAPEIVDRYGEFSSELLQVMLGIEVIESSSPIPAAPKELKDKKTSEESSTESAVVGIPVPPQSEREHVFIEEKRYKKLEPKVQEIIAAGRMGMPVKPCILSSSYAISQEQKTTPRAVTPKAPLEFEVDQKTAQVEHDRADSTLSYPNAALVRSMRRCERKLLPLLNKWTTVDVVVTEHEMVYVDVHDGDEEDFGEDELKKRNASKEAVRATHGGKGLRLCDVTAGRRIVGHLSFKDVLSVHVEREPASTGSASLGTPADGNDVDVGVREHNEYWQSNTNTEASTEAKQNRWKMVNQDRLKLLTAHGTMYLRFHSDLVDSELHPERVIEEVGDESPLHKDIAFQWAQTIVWNCGIDQLHQPLPHFGNDDGDELRDYLQIVSKEKKHGHRHHHRRLSSFTPNFDRAQSFSIRRMGSRGHNHKRSQSPTKRGRSPPATNRADSHAPQPPSSPPSRRHSQSNEENKQSTTERGIVEC